MRTSETIVNITKALHAAQSEFVAVPKGGRNTHHGYNYARLEDILGAVSPVLAKHDLSLISGTQEVRVLDGRKSNAILANLSVRLLHTSGEWIEVDCCGEGQDQTDKSVYKAITGARKYGIACLLNLTTSDDPEATDQDGKKNNRATDLNKQLGLDKPNGQLVIAKSARDAIVAAWKAQGLPGHRMVEVAGWLKDHGAASVEKATLNQRAELLQLVKSGHFNNNGNGQEEPDYGL